MKNIKTEFLRDLLNRVEIEVDEVATMIDYEDDNLKLYAFINNDLLDDSKRRELEDVECELNGEWYDLPLCQKELIRLHLIGKMNLYFIEKEALGNEEDSYSGAFTNDDYNHFENLIYN